MIEKNVIAVVCDECKISEPAFYTRLPRSNYDLSKALSICTIILFDMKYRHPDIAKMINRNRSTIYYYISRHSALLFSDRLYRETFERIKERLKEKSIL